MTHTEKLVSILAMVLTMTGCTDAVVGESAYLKTSLPQSLIGAFPDRTLATGQGDLDGDGLADVVVYQQTGGGGRVMWREGEPPVIEYDGTIARVYVYYGSRTGLPERLEPADADATFTLPAGEHVERVNVADLDGDGAAELVLRAPKNFSGDPEAGSLYIAAGGERRSGEIPLASIASATAMRFSDLYDLRAALPSDLDGEAGLEVLVHEPIAGSPRDATRVAVRSVDDGRVVASLEPRAGETLWALGVLDIDQDGALDIVCGYNVASADGSVLTDYGIGVFYGPVLGERRLGDAATARLDGGPDLYSPVVGNFTGDASDDLVMLGRDGVYALTAGTRHEDGALVDALDRLAASAIISADPDSIGPWIGRRDDRDGDGVDELVAVVGGRVLILSTAGRVLNELELMYRDGRSVGSFYGGDLGDVDGNGSLDLVMGTTDFEGGATAVHVVYGFAG